MLSTILLYSSLGVAIIALILGYNACARLGKFIKATNDLEWNDVANLTGEIATMKKTIQTLNNRMNGMNSPKLQEQEILAQFLNQKQTSQSNGRLQGG